VIPQNGLTRQLCRHPARAGGLTEPQHKQQKAASKGEEQDGKQNSNEKGKRGPSLLFV